MPPDAKYLRDMLDAAEAIVEYTRGRGKEDYLRDRVLRDAVQRNFCVIGEALARLLAIDPSFGSRISDARKIVGLRNQLIHGYGVIDDNITWDILENKLPTLIAELRQLLSPRA